MVIHPYINIQGGGGMHPMVLENELIRSLAGTICERGHVGKSDLAKIEIARIAGEHPFACAQLNAITAQNNFEQMPAYPNSIIQALETLTHEMFEMCTVVPVLMRGGEFRNGSGEIVLREIEEMQYACGQIYAKQFDFLFKRINEKLGTNSHDVYFTLDEKFAVSTTIAGSGTWWHFYVEFRVFYADQLIGKLGNF